MTNYESIKNMSLEQMTITMYLLVAPFMEAAGEVTPEVRAKAVEEIKDFLLAEVKK